MKDVLRSLTKVIRFLEIKAYLLKSLYLYGLIFFKFMFLELFFKYDFIYTCLFLRLKKLFTFEEIIF